MNLSGIPRAALLAAAQRPENSASRDALLKAAGVSPAQEVGEGENAPQRGTGAAEGARTRSQGKRRGVANKTEARFALEVLQPMVARGELATYRFEDLTFHLHGVARYTPDWVGYTPEGVPVLFEVKAWKIHDGSLVRTKAHAAARPWLRWRVYARRDGAWRVWFDSAANVSLAEKAGGR